MLIVVFSLCFIGAIVVFIGIAFLNSGILAVSTDESPMSGRAGTDILRGLINIIIGVAFILGSYLFMKFTVENREWWKRMR